MDEREVRFISTELRVSDDGAIEGYAAVFDQWSEDLWGFREIVRQGAFKRTIKQADVRALFNHDSNYVLGRNKADTLTLAEDDHGLRFAATPPDTQWADDLRKSIMRGDIDQGSFQFATVKDRWTHNNDDKLDERELLEVKLYDVSVVTFPAYPQTSITARSLAHQFIRKISDHADPAALEFMREQLNQFENSSDPEQGFHSRESEEGQDETARARVLAAHMLRTLQVNDLIRKKLGETL